jgi:antitoxin YefM
MTDLESLTTKGRTLPHCRPRRATIVAMAIQPLRYVRDHLSELIDQVDREHERIEVTKNGRVVAVILNHDELTALEETLAVLADPEVLADIRAADAAYATGDVVRGADAVRALRPPTA